MKIRNYLPVALALGLAVNSSAEKTAAKPDATAPAKPEAPAAPAAPEMDPVKMKTNTSYMLGLRTGAGFSQQFGKFGVGADDLDEATFLKGFMVALRSQKPEIEEAELQAAMEALGSMLQTREKQIAATNLEAGKKFFEANGKKPGVITTKSGLQYEILEKGGDEKYVAPKEGAEDNKQFLVNYKGMLIDGKEFDASPPGEPAVMTLQVVDGFREALTSMPVGAKWKVYLPSNLAYGEERRSSDIGPNSALVFELNLVKIEDAPPQSSMPFPMPQGGPSEEE